jgi:hypothetical protein
MVSHNTSQEVAIDPQPTSIEEPAALLLPKANSTESLDVKLATSERIRGLSLETVTPASVYECHFGNEGKFCVRSSVTLPKKIALLTL